MGSHKLEQLAGICRKAGEFQLQHFGKIHSGQIQDKGLNQLVSFVDIETEKLLVAGLGEIEPEAGYITEENTVKTGELGALNWIIDPLDGTTNFLHGLGAFSISVALYKGAEPLLGVVYCPVWNEMFTAEKGRGAFLNGEPINVSKMGSLKDSLLATGFPYYEFEHMEPYLDILRALMKNTHGLRRIGSAAIDLAYTACGRFEGFFEFGLHAWDVAAGILLVQEAGGMVTDFRMGNDYLYGSEILASCPGIHQELLEAIRKYHS